MAPISPIRRTTSNKPVAALDLEHLTGAEVLAFLQHIERERRATVNTRNCRLAALRSFFPLSGNTNRAPRSNVPKYCECHSNGRHGGRFTTWIRRRFRPSLSQPDRSTVEGQRDHTLMSLLYNTGARIQEALDLRPQDIHLKSPAHVRIMGKGRKERISPIWPETAALITALIQRQPRKPDEPIFVNRYRAPLTASGFRFRLRQYVKAAAEGVPAISKKRVTPHLFRHSTAVHLVAAGVDVTVIRSWLGHAHLDTTNHYAQANMDTKRKALELVDPKLRPAKLPRWKRDADLLAWLDSL
jgi:site-specific recombinase XerD